MTVGADSVQSVDRINRSNSMYSSISAASRGESHYADVVIPGPESHYLNSGGLDQLNQETLEMQQSGQWMQ